MKDQKNEEKLQRLSYADEPMNLKGEFTLEDL